MQHPDLDGAESRDPVAWFLSALARAQQSEGFDPTRAALATVSVAGVPAVRFVLVKEVDARGFTFFTNYGSHKARDLDANPNAALAFHWESLGLQVRVQGVASRIAPAESDAYFATRPRQSQLGAWASTQSAEIENRAALDAELERATKRFADESSIPRPPHWGGFRIAPTLIEIWRDQRGRLHDRYCYTRGDDGAWTCVRLQP